MTPFVLLAALPGPSGAPGGSEAPVYLTMMPIIILFVVLYFLLLAPERRKQKKTQEMLTALKSGDRVVMRCGIFGTIVGLTGDVVQLRVSDKVKIDVAKSSIAGLQRETPAVQESK